MDEMRVTADAELRPPRPARLGGLCIAAVLLVSAALRVVLVLSGGQGFWPDEARYLRSRVALASALRGDWAEAAAQLGHPDHVLFPILGLVPAALEPATRSESRILDLSDAVIPALFFASFSVAALFLLYGVARRLGETRASSCLAALLFALAATQLYQSRHLLPYDAAMGVLLASLYIGLRRPDRPRDSLLCGVLACAGFLTYNGYWLLAAFAGAAHVLRSPHSARVVLRRAVLASAGFGAPIAAIAACDAALHGDFFGRWAEFAATVTQGGYAEGWRLPFAYLWRAEHLMTLLWAASFAYAAARLLRGERSPSLALGVSAIVFLYAGLVAVSVGLHRFVVYGRHARQLVPFACLLSGAALGRLAARRDARSRAALAAILAAAGIQAALDFRQPLAQVFPDRFRRLANAVPDPGGEPRRILYAGHIYPTPPPLPPDAGEVLLARDHPLQYLPYQYEGYTPAQRQALRTTDIRMRLVRVNTPSAPPGR